MKALKKNDLGVSPVIAVILMVAITVVLAGVVFLWAQSFTDDAGGDVEKMNVKGVIDDSDDDLIIEVISGKITWGNYKVTVDGSQLTTVTVESNAGDTAIFNDDVTPVTFTAGTEYTVKIINIGDNKVVWEDDIIATV
ncbi:MAG: type IV pilin [Thermoplasmatota archaeon]